MFFRIISLLAAMFLATPHTAMACIWNTDYVSASATPKAAKSFKKINRAMSIQTIVKALGPAARDVGSGLYVLEWDVSDGRVFHVSVASACEKPLAIGFGRKMQTL